MALLPCAPMLISDFDYELPDELIAQYPAPERRGSRLLDLQDAYRRPAFRRTSGRAASRRSAGLQRHPGHQGASAGHQGNGRARGNPGRTHYFGRVRCWRTCVPARSPRTGSRLMLAGGGRGARAWDATASCSNWSFRSAVSPYLERHGEVPLPPYLKRPAERGRCRSLPDRLRERPGSGRGTDGGTAFRRGHAAGDAGAWACSTAGLRCTSVPAHFSRCAKSRSRQTGCTRNVLEVSQQCCDAVHDTRAAGRARHCGRHHLRARAGIGIGDRFAAPFQRRDGPVHSSGLPRSVRSMR